ncbi:MAG: T9SS type A sorting domain-containing protein [Bacteroidota bacterium]
MPLDTHLGRTLLFLVLTLGTSASLSAQEFGNCIPGSASATLNENEVAANLFTNGNLFFDGTSARYEVPQGGGVQAVFAQGLWVAGEVDGELRISAATYGGYEFWPGPLGDDAEPPADCSDFDRIWVVSREDIDTFEDSGVGTLDLIEWPAEFGAPVIDGDGNPDNYNLEAGDRPRINGDQSAWWVTNDVGNAKQTTLSNPLGLEVRTLAFASNLFLLRQSTFYEYTVINKNSLPIENAYLAIFSDPDLGDFEDDYIGSDPERGLGFVYNGDENDSPAAGGYGTAPPALGYDFFQGPIINEDVPEVGDDMAPDTLGITFFTYFNNANCDDICDPDQGTAQSAQQYFNYMTGRWKDGTRLEFGGDGYSDTEDFETNFAFPGNPPDYWSEADTDSDGLANPPGDRRFVISTGPFTLAPGESQTITLGILWARGSDRFDSIAQLKALDDEVQLLYENDALSAEDALPASGFAVGAAYPNPFVRSGDAVRVPYRLDAPEQVEVHVYDLLGRRVATLTEGPQSNGVNEVTWMPSSSLPSGMYFVQVLAESGRETVSVVVR